MFCRNRRSLIVPPHSRTLEQRSFIMPVGTKTWKDVNWDGRGHRSIIIIDQGTICHYMYPSMVSVGGLMHAARSWDDWGCKTYADQGSYQDIVWRKFWVS
jgi:hypothetical protein